MQLIMSAGVTALWVTLVGMQPALRTVPPSPPDPIAQTVVQQYLNDLAEHGDTPSQQGVWLQSEQAVLAHHQGTVPLPVASLTKVATTLAALRTWGPTHRFVTLVSATGPIQDGVLRGDLVVKGGGDPFFVSEDARTLMHTLYGLGLRRVTGSLVIAGDFYMNFTTHPVLAGKVLKQAFQAGGRPVVIKTKSRKGARRVVPAGPHIAIAGPVELVSVSPARQTPLIRHRSQPLVQLLKRMNVYSSNVMAGGKSALAAHRLRHVYGHSVCPAARQAHDC
jgi:D-alanyl-D-alanine carboxypeptidase/D-alanyl-D-alanine-endopeptidase (penicillin-binding protein 4)